MSMAAGLRALAAMARGRRTWAVLGSMAELGSFTEQAHRDAGRLAAELGIDRVVAVGDDGSAMVSGVADARTSTRADHIADIDAAIALLRAQMSPGDVVLVKASRSAEFERVAEALLGGGARVKGVLLAAVVALITSLLGTPIAIRFLRERGYGQLIRDDGPTTHHTKRGTPTMGGAVIIIATVLGYLAAHLVGPAARQHRGCSSSS